jgi:uncharacterized membrane protein
VRRLPGELSLRIALGILAVAGLGVSGYLTSVRFAGDEPVCLVGGGCHTVQQSEYAELAGIPVAVLGIIGYATLLVAALLPGQLGRALGLFTALVSFGFSAWLTFAELFIIDAICIWCVTSAVLITLALVVTVARALGAGASPGGSARPSAQDRLPQEPIPPASR